MFRTFLFSILFASLSLPASAQEYHAHGEILSAYQATGTFTTLDMGLKLSLDEPWYTYWRAPGDAGLAPSMDWSESENVQDVKVLWPAPKRFQTLDIYSFGYDGTVIFPLQVTPKKPAEDIVLKLKLDLVVCHEVCIPETLLLEKSVPRGPAAKSQNRATLTEAIKALPAYENTRDLSIDTAILGKDAITIVAEARKGFSDDLDMFIETPGIVLTAKPEIVPQDDGKKAVIKIKGPEGVNLTSHLLGKTVVIVLRNGSHALEREFSF